MKQDITRSPATKPIPAAFRRMTDDERQASLNQTMSGWDAGQDIWVYGYGSLIWRPEFSYQERYPALLHGYHRKLCLWSRINRGTPEHPGLVFGLDAGGSCRGIVFRIAADHVPSTADALWQREMPSGAYTPKWLNCRTERGNVKALTFIMNRNTDAYVPSLPLDRLVSIISSAHGTYGPCLEYVLETAQALKQSNIHDKRLQHLVQHLQTIVTA